MVEFLIKSMTGFGTGEICNEQIKCNVEMKSVNHRYCEIVLRMPRSLHVLEDRMRRLIQKEIARGRVDVFIKMELTGPGQLSVKVDEDLAASYLQAMNQIKDKFGLSGEITVTDLLQLESIIILEESDQDAEQWWPTLESALTMALEGLTAMRIKEGEQLITDIRNRAATISTLVEEIESCSGRVVDEYRERLHLRLRELMDLENFNQTNLEAEVIIFADRSNITEEIVRLHSHLLQLTECLESKLPVGRKMDFLLQEMNREINTIGSKSSDLFINRNVVEVKSELEKIREQIQNIE